MITALHVATTIMLPLIAQGYRVNTIAGGVGAGFGGDNGPANRAPLNEPRGLSLDRAGSLFIADTGNSAVRKIDPGGIITTVAGTGKPGYSGDGGPATKAQLYEPTGVYVDEWGVLYIADCGNNRIRRVDRAGRIMTVAGDGKPSNA